MPRAPKKCGKLECENRVVAKYYCPEHTPSNWHRGTISRNTPTARTFRKEVLDRDKGVCQIRGAGCTHRATTADHIIPLAWGGTDDPSNGQAACSPCHAVKTKAEAAEGRRRAAAR